MHGMAHRVENAVRFSLKCFRRLHLLRLPDEVNPSPLQVVVLFEQPLVFHVRAPLRKLLIAREKAFANPGLAELTASQ